ncbi:hypothetical protein PFISCL1PPCAC_147 [Pristionchus fissidentatus]|uniref:Uncharacterized protein n=1 Tax=Pristionchus fissidentatus TaxID=1538716 RepID=A0AAV5UST9_9BILA|nr:hypothetical protein PFISCL1PPCAC_147 [Pristionchus fissidentatus]
MVQFNHCNNPLYILNGVHVLMHFIALFCLTIMWDGTRIFIEIINFWYAQQLVSVLCLLFTLVISGYVCFGGLFDQPVLGSWPKQRIEIIHAIGLAALILSVGLQTWTVFSAWAVTFFMARYLIACISSWILLLSWIGFLVLHLLKVRH